MRTRTTKHWRKCVSDMSSLTFVNIPGSLNNPSNSAAVPRQRIRGDARTESLALSRRSTAVEIAVPSFKEVDGSAAYPDDTLRLRLASTSKLVYSKLKGLLARLFFKPFLMDLLPNIIFRLRKNSYHQSGPVRIHDASPTNILLGNTLLREQNLLQPDTCFIFHQLIQAESLFYT